MDTVNNGVNVTTVTASATVVDILSRNVRAKYRTVYNDSSAALYLKHGTGASTTSFTVKIAADGFYEFPARPLYVGPVTGVWASATGAARVTEG